MKLWLQWSQVRTRTLFRHTLRGAWTLLREKMCCEGQTCHAVFEGRSFAEFVTSVVLLQLDNVLKGQLHATKALWNTKGDH